MYAGVSTIFQIKTPEIPLQNSGVFLLLKYPDYIYRPLLPAELSFTEVKFPEASSSLAATGCLPVL